MNKYQRGVLIVTGILIAAFQIYGIDRDGLDGSRGWALSFVLAAVLLFIGRGSWKGFGLTWFTKVVEKPTSSSLVHSQSVRAKVEEKKPVGQPKQSNKYEYGIHISELDIAIEAHKKYCEKTGIDAHTSGNGRSLNWNCCLSIYASMRYVQRKLEMNIYPVVWNTIIHAIVVRMTSDEIEGVKMSQIDPVYVALEGEAYSQVEVINGAIEEALSDKWKHPVDPIIDTLETMFGADEETRNALVVIVMTNVDKAQEKIIPELLADLS